MASPRRVSRVLYLLGRGRRAATRGFAEAIGNEASLARMTALGAVEAVCYQLARAAGEVDNLGLPPPKKDE